jgi:hypothetical protein
MKKNEKKHILLFEKMYFLYYLYFLLFLWLYISKMVFELEKAFL